MKREIVSHYNLTYPTPFKVEFDHLIPRELGGADSLDNIWPEEWEEARHIKDPEENKWHRMVCAGNVSLEEAQQHFRMWGVRVGSASKP